MAFNPMTQVSAFHVMWADDPSWSHPADGGNVSSWRNGGTVGGDPANASAPQQPIWHTATTAFGGRATVESVGGKILFFDVANISQPFKTVTVCQHLNTTGTRMAFGLNNVNTGLGVIATNWNMAAGSSLSGTTAPDLNPHVFRANWNTTSSSLFIDGSQNGTTSTVGSDILAQLYLFAGAGLNNQMIGHIAFHGVYNSSTPDADLQALESDLGYYYALKVRRPLPPRIYTGPATMRASVT